LATNTSLACLCHKACVTSTVVSDGWDWVEPEVAAGETSDTAVRDWMLEFHRFVKKVSRLEQSRILKGDGAHKGRFVCTENVGCAVGTLHCWAGHAVAKFVELDWEQGRKRESRPLRIFALPRRPCRANTTTAASGRREKP
jgi:hypothetical protein